MAEEATPTPAAQSAPQVESDDSLISDILKGDTAKEPLRDRDGGDDADGDQAEADADEEHAEPDTAEDTEDASLTEDAAEPDDAAEPEEDGGGTLAAARKARDEGDLDKAFKLAFGCKPEELFPNDKTWTKWRAANNKREQAFRQQESALAAERQQGQQWVLQQRQQISGIIEQLKPYEKYYLAEQAFRREGDPQVLVDIITGVSGMSYDEAQKMILTKQRRSPGERALQQQVQSLMQKLEEQERKKAEETQTLTQQQQYQADLTLIRGQLKGEVTKVPKFAERVYQVLVKTRTPTGLSMSVEEAGRRVLHAERQRIAKHPLVPKPPPKPEVSKAASTLAKARKDKAAPPPLRRDSRGNGTKEEGSETTDDIIGDILGKTSKRRVG
jgi:hypothetical protein